MQRLYGVVPPCRHRMSTTDPFVHPQRMHQFIAHEALILDVTPGDVATQRDGWPVPHRQAPEVLSTAMLTAPMNPALHRGEDLGAAVPVALGLKVADRSSWQTIICRDAHRRCDDLQR